MSRRLGNPVARVAVLVVMAVAAVACGTGGLPATSPSAAAATHAASPSLVASPPATSVASPAADPTPVPTRATAEPPVALLSGEHMSGEPLVGSLGTFTWGAEGSDAPWIVPQGASDVAAGTPLAVSLDPAIVPASWTARWAPVTGGAASDVASSQDGTGTVSLVAPDAAGDWSLQLDARFGEGHGAVWYWRIHVR